jgi:hypothetical protein
MHVHLPKAFHGWRELAKEVGIIVLGVLIALGFEQLVQAWQWHERVQTTREALSNEIVLSALWAEERLAVKQCLHDRVAHLVTELNRGRADWTADPMTLRRARNPIGEAIQTSIPLVYRTPHRPWLSAEWQTAKSTGVVDHMGRDDVRDLEFIFGSIEELRTYQDEENSLEPQLSFLSFNQTLQPQSRVQALVTLARLDYLNATEAETAQQMLSAAKSRHLPFGRMRIGPRITTLQAATDRVVSALRDRYGRCVVAPPAIQQTT